VCASRDNQHPVVGSQGPPTLPYSSALVIRLLHTEADAELGGAEVEKKVVHSVDVERLNAGTLSPEP
jgi:hypothetical protein